MLLIHIWKNKKKKVEAEKNRKSTQRRKIIEKEDWKEGEWKEEEEK